MKSESMFRFGIRGKLLFLTGGMLVVFLAATIFSIIKVDELKEQVEFLGLERIPLSFSLGDIRSASNAAPRFSWLALAYPPNSIERKKSLEKLVVASDMLVDSAEKYAKFHLTSEAKSLIELTIPLTKDVRTAIFDVKKMIELNTSAGDIIAKEMLLKNMPPIAVKVTQNMELLAKMANTRNAEVVAIAQAKSKSAQMNLILIAAFTALISSIVGFLFSTKLTKELLYITEQVGDASSQVSAASGELSASSEELSNSAQGQAAAVEEASASLTEISGMIEANVKNSEDSNKLTVEVYRYSEETKVLMNELSNAMTKILESNSKIEKLVKVIEEVGAKTEVIDDIVFKTQLLSFNASVEAERAGEHGRGFAVVAQEVGNLAQMSGKAANEISSIVKISIKEADEIARENKERVENGGRLALSANKKMTEVMEKILQIQASTNKVVEASKEQSQGINQITTSVESINQSTQETASTSEESASASEELSGQSEALLGLVNNLRMIVTGDANYQHVELKRPMTNKKSSNVIDFNSKNKKSSLPKKVSVGKVQVSKLNSENFDDAWEKI